MVLGIAALGTPDTEIGQSSFLSPHQPLLSRKAELIKAQRDFAFGCCVGLEVTNQLQLSLNYSWDKLLLGQLQFQDDTTFWGWL